MRNNKVGTVLKLSKTLVQIFESPRLSNIALNNFCLYTDFFLVYGSQSIVKGVGHAILGNFSTDQMVIELPKISK